MTGGSRRAFDSGNPECVIARPSNNVCTKTLKRAFSLIELLVVVTLIGVLAALLLPSLGGAKLKAQGLQCLTSERQLSVAVQNYTGDSSERFPPNPDDGNTVAGHHWCGGQAGIGGSEEFNPDILADSDHSLLAPYLGRVSAVFKCPADLRSGIYQGSRGDLVGRTIPAARSYSMNQAIGTICSSFDVTRYSHVGAPVLSVNAHWLNNPDDNHRNAPWLTYGKITEHMNNPGPANLWILVDEAPSSLNDASFSFGMVFSQWLDRPASFHGHAASFAFVDGHSEIHRWLDASTWTDAPKGSRIQVSKRDWMWMRQRTSAHIKGVMPPPR